MIQSESRASPREREPKNDERRRLIFRSVRTYMWYIDAKKVPAFFEKRRRGGWIVFIIYIFIAP